MKPLYDEGNGLFPGGKDKTGHHRFQRLETVTIRNTGLADSAAGAIIQDIIYAAADLK